MKRFRVLFTNLNLSKAAAAFRLHQQPFYKYIFQSHSLLKSGNRILKFLFFISVFICFQQSSLIAQDKFDPSYGEDGIVIYPHNGWEGAWSAVVQLSGKVVVAGWRSQAQTSNTDVLLMRFNFDGSFDSTFKSGNFISYLERSWEDAYAVTLQEDQKILVAGRYYNGNDWDFLLIRFNPEGDIDSTFGTEGFVITDLSMDDRAFAVDVQQDGKIIIVGYSFKDSTYLHEYALLRFNSDGTPDLTFGDGGAVLKDFFGSADIAFSAKVQDDGRIITCGWSYKPSGCDFALVRYNSDGTLDNTFGDGGKVFTDNDFQYNSAHSIDVLEDGKYLVAGYTYYRNRPDYDIMLTRYNTDGSMDVSFGQGGYIFTDIDQGNEFAWNVKQLRNGMFTVAGSYTKDSVQHVLTLRYKKDGTLDYTFTETGYSLVKLFGEKEEARGIALGNGSEFYITGFAFNGEDTDIFLLRYSSEIMNMPSDNPSASTLLQNYPNPFNSECTVRYLVRKESNIQIKLFDMLGRQIKIIVNEYKYPGEYDFSINTGDLASGVYIYQLESDYNLHTKKLVFIK